MRLLKEIFRDMLRPLLVILTLLLIMALASACTLNLIKIEPCVEQEPMKQCADKSEGA